jgi:hypothetical protein
MHKLWPHKKKKKKRCGLSKKNGIHSENGKEGLRNRLLSMCEMKKKLLAQNERYWNEYSRLHKNVSQLELNSE